MCRHGRRDEPRLKEWRKSAAARFAPPSEGRLAEARRDVSSWPFASFRDDAAIQSLSEAKRIFSEPRLPNRIYEYAPETRSVCSISNYLFCSDELAKRIKDAGIEGWRFRRCKLKNDS